MKSVTFLLDDDVYAKIEEWGHDNDRSFSEALRHGLRIFFMPASEPEKVKRGRTPFVRPDLDEIRSYVLEKRYSFDPEAFQAFYDSKGWKVGGQPMRDWRAACVTWQKRHLENGHADVKPPRGNVLRNPEEEKRRMNWEADEWLLAKHENRPPRPFPG